MVVSAQGLAAAPAAPSEPHLHFHSLIEVLDSSFRSPPTIPHLPACLRRRFCFLPAAQLSASGSWFLSAARVKAQRFLSSRLGLPSGFGSCSRRSCRVPLAAALQFKVAAAAGFRSPQLQGSARRSSPVQSRRSGLPSGFGSCSRRSCRVPLAAAVSHQALGLVRAAAVFRFLWKILLDLDAFGFFDQKCLSASTCLLEPAVV